MGIGYLYNGKELDSDLGLDWHAFGFRYYDAAIGRFTGVDPISEQFAHVSTYNYAENEPVKHIDLWGLQKYYSKDAFLGSYGDSEEMRVVSDGVDAGFAKEKLANPKSIDSGYFDFFLSSNSTTAYPASEEKSLLLSWAAEYGPKSSDNEYGVSLYTRTIMDENGDPFDVISKGSSVKGEGQQKGGGYILDIEKSKGFAGWNLLSMIHTHPNGGEHKFSDEWGMMGGRTGDIASALEFKVRFYMVNPIGRILEFDPAIYEANVRRGSFTGDVYNHDEAKDKATNENYGKIKR